MESERPALNTSTETHEARKSTPRSLREPSGPEEIKRRQEVLARILKLREQTAPLDIPAGELVRRARREEAQLDD
jgi:hypothetical protein